MFEAVSLGRLHLVDVLEEVSHPHRGVELARVVRRALPAAVAVGRAAQQAAGLVDGAALLVWERKRRRFETLLRTRRRGAASFPSFF